MHAGYIINRNKGFGIKFIYEFHQFLILTFVDNGDNLIVFFKIVGTGCFIYSSTAVQTFNNKTAQFFLLSCNNSDASIPGMIKNKIIQNDSVKVSTEKAQHNGFFVINQRCGKRHAHTGKRHRSS